jgi:hypothetical protein
MPGPFKDGLQMATVSECRYRWLRVPATTDTDAPVVKAAGAFFFVTIPIACLEASLYDRCCEGLRTPAPVCAAPPSWGRHPQTFTKADFVGMSASGGYCCKSLFWVTIEISWDR